MPRYVKNRLRADTIRRFGQQVGLPLFEQTAPDHIVARMGRAPKSIALATDTRKLGEITAKIDPLRLSEKQQIVLDMIQREADWSYQELARELSWQVNRVIPRVYELRQLGLVIPSRKRSCAVTGMVIQAWKAI